MNKTTFLFHSFSMGWADGDVSRAGLERGRACGNLFFAKYFFFSQFFFITFFSLLNLVFNYKIICLYDDR